MKRARGLTWEDVCAYAKTLPGVEEGTSYGTPALRVKRTFLARLREDGETLVVPVDPDERPLLVEGNPDELFVTKHHENGSLVLVALPQTRPQLVHELLEHAWAAQAPKRVVDAWLAEREGARA